MKNYLEKEFYELIKRDKRIFEYIQKKATDGIWYWDIENPDNEWLSDEFWTDLGYDPRKMESNAHAWKNHIFPEDLKLAETSLQNHVDDPNIPYEIIIRYKHKNGSTIYIHSEALSIIDKNGKPYRVLGVRKNITKAIEYKLEKENSYKLNALNQKLKRQNDTLKEFSFLTSHDLQEPINTIISYLSLLNESKKNMDDVSKLSLSVIEKSAYRMKDFVTSLLNYIVIGNERECEEFYISEIFESVQESLEALILNKKGTIILEFEDFKVNTFKNDIHRLIYNLIENGLKYSRTNVNSFIKVSVIENKKNYTFSFLDNGIGIEQQYNKVIFKAFKRLHSKDEYEGTGIGLAECKKIIQLFNGKIWVESVYGKGSTFQFSIPKQQLIIN